MGKKTESKALTQPGSWKEVARKSVGPAKAVAAALPQAGGNFISLRGGNIALGGNKLANPLSVIVLAHQQERSYYSTNFDPGKPAAPDCYSYDGGKPHELSPDKQNATCVQCPFNEFGSAKQGGGKGCKEGVKLALVSSDTLKDSDKFMAAPIVQVRLSVLNAKIWAGFCQAFLEDDRPLWAQEILLRNESDERSQYRVSFSLGKELPDKVLDVIALRIDEASKLLLTPYPKLEQAAVTAKPKSGGRRAKF